MAGLVEDGIKVDLWDKHSLSHSARHLRDGGTAHGIRLPSLIFSDG